MQRLRSLKLSLALLVSFVSPSWQRAGQAVSFSLMGEDMAGTGRCPGAELSRRAAGSWCLSSGAAGAAGMPPSGPIVHLLCSLSESEICSGILARYWKRRTS